MSRDSGHLGPGPWISWYRESFPQTGDVVNVTNFWIDDEGAVHFPDESGGNVFGMTRSLSREGIEFSQTDTLMFVGSTNNWQASFLFDGQIYTVGLFRSFFWRLISRHRD
jgi:hypothetical protein